MLSIERLSISSCDMDDQITLDDHWASGRSLFILCDTFHFISFLVNWLGRGLVMDDHMDKTSLIQLTIKNNTQRKKICTKICLLFNFLLFFIIFIFIMSIWIHCFCKIHVYSTLYLIKKFLWFSIYLIVELNDFLENFFFFE